jgi:hypothetical protein
MMRCHEKPFRVLSLRPKSVNRHFLYISRNANRKTTVLGCRHRVPAIFSLATLSVVISLRYRIFLPACLPRWVGLCSATVYCQVLLIFEIFSFGFSDTALEVLLVLPGIRCLFVCVSVRLIKFWQHYATDVLSLLWPWSLSAFVHKANVWSCKATLFHVCVLLLKKRVLWLYFKRPLYGQYYCPIFRMAQ